MKSHSELVPVVIAQPATSIVALSEEVVAQVAEILNRSAVIQDVSAATLTVADEIYAEIHRLHKAVETSREEAKRPVLAIGRAIDAAAKRATEILDYQKRRLGAMIHSYQTREQARREEEHRRALEEQARKEAELLAKVRAETPPWEDPVVIAAAEVAALAQAPTPPPPEPVRTSVRTSTTYRVRLDNAALVPREYLVPDITKILADLRAGIAVPGCQLETVVGTAAKGRT